MQWALRVAANLARQIQQQGAGAGAGAFSALHVDPKALNRCTAMRVCMHACVVMHARLCAVVHHVCVQAVVVLLALAERVESWSAFQAVVSVQTLAH